MSNEPTPILDEEFYINLLRKYALKFTEFTEGALLKISSHSSTNS